MGAAFKPRPNREGAAIVVSVYKLAVKISIGAGLMGTMFGLWRAVGTMTWRLYGGLAHYDCRNDRGMMRKISLML